MADNELYVCQVIENETDAIACARLIAEEFSEHEPLTKFCRIENQSLFDAVVWPSLKDSLASRLSLLIRYSPTNEIVAAITADDLYSTAHQCDWMESAKEFAILYLLADMELMFIHNDFGQELKPNQVLHVWMGATRKEHSGKGLAVKLRSALFDHAKRTKGFKYAYIQATNPATRHIYVNKMGAKVVSELDPSAWLWSKKDDGTSRPFKDFQGGLLPNILLEFDELDKINGIHSS